MAAAALAPELLVQLDPGRFRADNLLGAEDWGEAGAWGGARGVGEGGEGAGRDAGGGEGAISRGKGGGVCGGGGVSLTDHFRGVACEGVASEAGLIQGACLRWAGPKRGGVAYRAVCYLHNLCRAGGA